MCILYKYNGIDFTKSIFKFFKSPTAPIPVSESRIIILSRSRTFISCQVPKRKTCEDIMKIIAYKLQKS